MNANPKHHAIFVNQSGRTADIVNRRTKKRLKVLKPNCYFEIIGPDAIFAELLERH